MLAKNVEWSKQLQNPRDIAIISAFQLLISRTIASICPNQKEGRCPIRAEIVRYHLIAIYIYIKEFSKVFSPSYNLNHWWHCAIIPCVHIVKILSCFFHNMLIIYIFQFSRYVGTSCALAHGNCCRYSKRVPHFLFLSLDGCPTFFLNVKDKIQ